MARHLAPAASPQAHGTAEGGSPVGAGRPAPAFRAYPAAPAPQSARPGRHDPVPSAAGAPGPAGAGAGPGRQGVPAIGDAGWLDALSASLTQAPEARVIATRSGRAMAAGHMRSAVARIALLLLCGWALLTYVFGVALVRGDGMGHTAGDGDVALYFRLGDSQIQADDVVVFRHAGHELLGRVVAQPGDEVEVTGDGGLYVNGAEQPSPDGGKTEPSDSGPAYPLTLGPDQWFVLGDGREAAVDSRQAGPIGPNDVEGRVVALLRLRGI